MKTVAVIAVSFAGFLASFASSFLPPAAASRTVTPFAGTAPASGASPALPGMAGSFEAEKAAAPLADAVDLF